MAQPTPRKSRFVDPFSEYSGGLDQALGSTRARIEDMTANQNRGGMNPSGGILRDLRRGWAWFMASPAERQKFLQGVETARNLQKLPPIQTTPYETSAAPTPATPVPPMVPVGRSEWYPRQMEIQENRRQMWDDARASGQQYNWSPNASAMGGSYSLGPLDPIGPRPQPQEKAVPGPRPRTRGSNAFGGNMAQNFSRLFAPPRRSQRTVGSPVGAFRGR